MTFGPGTKPVKTTSADHLGDRGQGTITDFIHWTAQDAAGTVEIVWVRMASVFE